jgi:hypothetical protein
MSSILYEVTHDIDGFTFTIGMSDFQPASVMLDNDNIKQLDNPRFLTAIKQLDNVLYIWEQYRHYTFPAYSFILQQSAHPHGKGLDVNQLYRDIAICTALFDQDIVDFNEWQIRHIQEALETAKHYLVLTKSQMEEATKRREKREVVKKNLISGYVYLLQSPTKSYKIGRSKNPQDRLKTFSVKLPFEVEYIALIETPDMTGLERQLHERFAEKRVNGEWFELSEEDVQYIQGLSNE